jgi:hypothetical protein
MPITGKFEADFESFHREVVKADGELRAFTATSGGVEHGFRRMSDTGGGALTTFHQGLSQADKTLAAFGVHIGPEIQAIKELGQASGKTASEIGLIGTAGLVAGAALAGWKIGGLIADLTGLDEAIGNVVARMMGWDDTAAVAGAKQDSINLAISRGANAMISYTEAVKFNEKWVKEHGNTMDTSRERVSAWQRELRRVRADGDLENLRKELDSGNSSLKQLSVEYGLSVEAIQYFQRETKKATEAQKERAETDRQYAKLMSDIRNEQGLAQMAADKATMDRAEANQEGLRLMAIDRIRWEEEVAEAAKVAAEKADQARQAEYDAWFKSVNEGVLIIGQAIDAVDAKVAGSLARTQTAVTSWSQAMQMVSAGAGTMSGTVPAVGGPWQATREQIQRSYEMGKYWGPVDQFGRPDYARILPQQNITINAQGAYFPDNASMKRFGNTVGNSVVGNIRNTGGRA